MGYQTLKKLKVVHWYSTLFRWCLTKGTLHATYNSQLRHYQLCHSFVRGGFLLPSQLPGEYTGYEAASRPSEPIWNAHYSSTHHQCWYSFYLPTKGWRVQSTPGQVESGVGIEPGTSHRKVCCCTNWAISAVTKENSLGKTCGIVCTLQCKHWSISGPHQRELNLLLHTNKTVNHTCKMDRKHSQNLNINWIQISATKVAITVMLTDGLAYTTITRADKKLLMYQFVTQWR